MSQPYLALMLLFTLGASGLVLRKKRGAPVHNGLIDLFRLTFVAMVIGGYAWLASPPVAAVFMYQYPLLPIDLEQVHDPNAIFVMVGGGYSEPAVQFRVDYGTASVLETDGYENLTIQRNCQNGPYLKRTSVSPVGWQSLWRNVEYVQSVLCVPPHGVTFSDSPHIPVPARTGIP